MTSKNYRAYLLCYIKLCASFESHRWIQTGVTVRKRPIRSKSAILLSRVTLKFDGWHWKTIGHIFYVASSFVHHSIAISDSKWSFSPETFNLGQNRRFFCPEWPSNYTDDLEKTTGHLFYATSSFVHHFVVIGEFKLELQSGNAQFGSKSTIFYPFDLEIWRLTLKNHRAPLLSSIKLYTSFHHHIYVNSNWTYGPETG